MGALVPSRSLFILFRTNPKEHWLVALRLVQFFLFRFLSVIILRRSLLLTNWIQHTQNENKKNEK